MGKLAASLITLVFLLVVYNAEAKIDPALEQSINDNINYISTTVFGDQETLDIMVNVQILLGQPSSNGIVDKIGFYGNFLHAYHFGYPASPLEWYFGSVFIRYYIERSTKYVRDRQMDWNELVNFKQVCEDAINEAKLDAEDNTPTRNTAKVDEALANCAENKLLKLVKDDLPDFKKQLKAAWAFSVDMLDRTLFLSYHGYHAYIIGGFLPHPSNAWNFFEIEEFPALPLTLFGRMLKETSESLQLIPKYLSDFSTFIQDLRLAGAISRADYLQTKLDEINDKLKAHPYDKLYRNGDPSLVKEWETALSSFSDFVEYDQNFSPFFLLFVSPYYPKEHPKVTTWFGKYYYDTLVEGENPLYKDDTWFDELQGYFTYTYDLYLRFLAVPPNTPTQADPDGDGEWQWDIQRNGIHSLRLAWDLLDKIVEELKCYLEKTYHYDLRNDALQATQQNLTHLYSSVSPTLFKPCVHNDTDLISEFCTKENNEICRPMHFNVDLDQNPDHETHGGRSLLKPKWYFEKVKGKEDCEGIRTFIVPYKICQCGFRLDCGADLGSERIICQLRSDYIRKQCRGSVGYPCKTLPLAPGRHHESCITGYCDMEENSCEDAPIKEHGRDRGSRTRMGWFSVLSVLFSTYF